MATVRVTGRQQTGTSELQSTWTVQSISMFLGRSIVVILRQQVSYRVMAMQHRAYQPLLPSGNKYLQQKWDKASYDLHRQKVKSAKPTISQTPPKSYGHLAVKLKTLKLEEEWKMKIEKENNMLMQKISHIMRTTGGVENRNCYERKSLGKEKRQLELLRITNENQMILFRLSQCRPHYNVRSWHEDWLKTLKVMDSIARYPRGRASQQKGQEKPNNKSTDPATHNPVTNNTNCKTDSEENEKRREATKTKETGSETQQDADKSLPEPNIPEKSTSPDTPQNQGSFDTVQITKEKHPHSAGTS
ncbi:hypothetical protein Q5P01_013794 [Channa striata]|uniref:Uncharacterized protein n=1 Tax=Channa striata TaxID=64152 RepID=A0AA88MNK3_CHASR|nr:hypothetical protein Q5P01_013794 [Channa striata]